MQTFRKIRKARAQAARRKLARKKMRWRDRVIIRGSGRGSNSQLTAPRRKHLNASRMR